MNDPYDNNQYGGSQQGRAYEVEQWSPTGLESYPGGGLNGAYPYDSPQGGQNEWPQYDQSGQYGQGPYGQAEQYGQSHYEQGDQYGYGYQNQGYDQGYGAQPYGGYPGAQLEPQGPGGYYPGGGYPMAAPMRPSVGFGQAIKNYFGNYVTFSGRASLSEFWWSVLFVFLVAMGLSVLGGVPGILWSLACFLPNLAVTVRRLHDTNKSGFMVLLGLIPLVGWIIMLVMLVGQPDPQGARFDSPDGSQPKT